MKNYYFLLILIIFSINQIQSQQFNSYIIKFKSINEKERYLSKTENKTSSYSFINDKLSTTKKDIFLSSKAINDFKKFENYVISSLPSNEIQNLYNNYEIESITPNYIYKIEQMTTKPNDARYSNQWALKDLNAEEAWKYADGSGIVVGVIDTGIDFEHPDLKNQLWINSGEDLNKNGKYDPWSSKELKNGIYGDFDGIDNDGNGFIDDVIGYDFVNQYQENLGDYRDFDPIPSDEMGHGTMVSGIIAAERNNNYGICGLAYNSKIMTMRAFDITGNGESQNIASAVLYAAINGAKVINCSFGDKFSSPLVYEAMKFARDNGCIIVASSGNNGWSDTHYPSDYEMVISVGASDINKNKYGYSNFGDNLAFLAPGVSILSTDFFSSFSEKTGTSFSSPYVASLVAMILQRNPTLNVDEVKGIISQSSKMKNTTDWNELWGSGIISPPDALSNTPPLEISIKYPINDQIINKSKSNYSDSLILINGTILAPMLQEYKLFIGQGYNSKKWDTLNTSSQQINNDIIAKIPLNILKDTTYVFRIQAIMKNGKIIEQRRRFQIVSNKSFQFISINSINPYYNDSKSTVVGIVTNMPSKAKVTFEMPSGKKYEFSDYLNYNNYHIINIPNYERHNGTIIGKAIAELNDGSSIEKEFSFDFIEEYFPLENYKYKTYTIKPSYLMNGSTKFYNDYKSFIANDLTGGIFGKLYSYIYNPNNQRIEIKDSLNKTLIPTAYGDSNNDGLQEVLFKANGTTALYQGTNSNSNPFSKLLFEDNLGNLWAQSMFNLDKVNGDEVICYSDTAYHIFSFENGSYKQIAQTKLPQRFKRIGTLPGLSIGDFDGDGNNEMLFSNDNGNIFVFRYLNKSLELLYIDSTNYSKSSQYITTGDFDGDGKPEIAVLNYTTKPLTNYEEFGEPIWLLRVIKPNQKNEYLTFWQTYIYGVKTGSIRNGITFRNGITSGNIDYDKNDEIIVSVFPNVYGFKFSNNKFIPLINIKNTFTNNCIIEDFDNNGVKELGFSDGNRTYFVEIVNESESPKLPLNFKAKLIEPTKIEFSWDKSINAESYDIYRLVNLNGSFFLYHVINTKLNKVEIDTFKLDMDYNFVIVSNNPNLKNPRSNYSEIISIHTALPWTIKDAFVNSNRIFIKFSGRLKFEPLETYLFKLIDSDKKEFFPSLIMPAKDSLLILTFSKTIPNGKLSIENSEFYDYWNNKVYFSRFNFINDYQEKEEKYLFLTKLDVNQEPHNLTVHFSDALKPESIKESSFIVFKTKDYPNEQNNLLIEQVNVNSDVKSVNIKINQNELIAALGKTYYVTCLNAESKDGLKIKEGAGNTLSFVLTNNELDLAYVYPNPIRYNNNEKIYFANLPLRATVKVYDIYMNLIKEIEESDGNGGALWDGYDSNGNLLDTGVYLFKVVQKINNNISKESELKKFAIIR